MQADKEYDEVEMLPLRILEKNNVSRSIRQAQERREELARVLRRVKNIYSDFDKPAMFAREFTSLTEAFFKNDNDQANVEYVEDIKALEERIRSQQWRDKHVQKVSVFVVGYSNMAADRLRLLQDVNQFFLNNEDTFDSFLNREMKVLRDNGEVSDEVVQGMGIGVNDMDDEPDWSANQLATSMEEALSSCESLTNKLGQLNADMIECLFKYMQNKAGNKGRKKLEKSLENAISDSHKLNEKLLETQNMVAEKDAKIEALMKQMELKTNEVQKFKAAAESIKKSALEADELRHKLKERDNRIVELETEIDTSQFKIDEVKRKDESRLADIEEAAEQLKEKNELMEKVIHSQKMEFEEDKRNMKRTQEAEIKKLKMEYESKLLQLKNVQTTEISKWQASLTDYQSQIHSLELSSEFDENAIDLQWSDTEDSQQMKRDSPSISPDKLSGIISCNNESFVDSIVDQEVSGLSINAADKRSKSQINDSEWNDVMEFMDAPDLDNEDFWSSVPRNHLLGRFFQYRQLSRAERSGLQDDIESSQGVTKRQVQSLKSQHAAHKQRWGEEREWLVEAVRKAENERQESQKLAESALREAENLLENKEKDENELGPLEVTRLAQKLAVTIKEKAIFDSDLDELLVELIKRCKLLEEQSRISLPKFATMIDLSNSKDRNTMLQQISSQNHSESESKLNENMDVLFPDDMNGQESKDVAISASPALFQIALIGSLVSTVKIIDSDDDFVTPDDLIVPKNMIDIQDQTGMSLIKHPIVCDYLRTYDVILTFKQRIIEILEALTYISSNDIRDLIEMKPVTVRSSARIIPQVEEIGVSIEHVLAKIFSILDQIINRKKSSKVQKSGEIKKEKLTPATIVPRSTNENQKNSKTVFGYISYELKQMKNDLRKTETVFLQKFNILNNSMIHVSQLVRKLSLLIQTNQDVIHKNSSEDNKKSSSGTIATICHPVCPDYSCISIMFTRKDSERNKKRMRDELVNNRLDDVIYEDAINKMADYIEIPPQRLLILVKKYIHKKSMEKIADCVRQNNKFSKKMFQILDGMEGFCETKSRRYDEIQEYLRHERVLRAQAMNETFDKIQQTSPVVLIRPIINKTSRKMLPDYIDRENILTKRDKLKQIHLSKSQDGSHNVILDKSVWKPELSNYEPEIKYSGESRLAEIDLTRTLLPINNISTEYIMDNSLHHHYGNTPPPLPPNVAVRSYVAVTHPTAVVIENPDDSTNNPKTNSSSRIQSSSALSKHSPLPPIANLIDADC